jgi:hypothetical protein
MVRATRTAPAFADEMDELVEEIAGWAADSIEEALDAIMGNDRPIFTEKKSEREQVTDYLKMRSDPMAWQQWMQERDEELRERIGVVFEAMQVPPEFIASIHPFDIVVRQALVYSRRMERLVTEYEGKTEAKLAQEMVEYLDG